MARFLRFGRVWPLLLAASWFVFGVLVGGGGAWVTRTRLDESIVERVVDLVSSLDSMVALVIITAVYAALTWRIAVASSRNTELLARESEIKQTPRLRLVYDGSTKTHSLQNLSWGQIQILGLWYFQPENKYTLGKWHGAAGNEAQRSGIDRYRGTITPGDFLDAGSILDMTFLPREATLIVVELAYPIGGILSAWGVAHGRNLPWRNGTQIPHGEFDGMYASESFAVTMLDVPPDLSVIGKQAQEDWLRRRAEAEEST